MFTAQTRMQQHEHTQSQLNASQRPPSSPSTRTPPSYPPSAFQRSPQSLHSLHIPRQPLHLLRPVKALHASPPSSPTSVGVHQISKASWPDPVYSRKFSMPKPSSSTNFSISV